MGTEIAAGDLDRRIAIERQGTARNGLNERIAAWAEIGRCWARFMPGTGQERREAAQEQATITATFRVRRGTLTAGVREKDRIRFDPAVLALPALEAPATTLPATVPAWDVVSVVPYGRGGFDITASWTG